MPEIKRHKIREDFLITFIKALIKNSAPPELKVEKYLPEKKLKISQSFRKQKNRNISNLPPMPMRSLTRRMKIAQPEFQQPQIQIPQQSAEQMIQGKINLGKVAQFLRDPSVLSVECTGPGKHLLINRSGAIQTTPATLTKEEIDKILSEISLQTQIPIVPGLFKALFRNLLITAVVSDYVGSRFIIQKRTPF